jgi:hypothetical protein
MENDINNLDPNDEGLKQIFGDRFHDATKDALPPKPAQKIPLKPRDADWEPVPHKPTQMEKLKSCAKSALLFGGLSLLFFYWQQTGQMEITASTPCICACCVLAGLGVGRNAV